jgi:protein arginine kinase activator
MKCEKCKENEANFFYKSVINGKTTEVRLCSDCAQEEGLMEALNWRGLGMFDNFLPDSCGMHGNFFGPSMFPGFGRNLMIPVLALPRIEIRQGEETHEGEGEARETEAKIPEDAGAELKAKRELLSLKHQLKEAVKAEDFEKAIELRDKIREIEK